MIGLLRALPALAGLMTAVPIALLADAATAQSGSASDPLNLFTPSSKGDLTPLRPSLDQPLGYAPSLGGAEVPVRMQATLVPDAPPLQYGLTWRIYGVERAADGSLPLQATLDGGTVSLTLPRGDYFVHAAFGRAGATKRISVGDGPKSELLVLDAGGLRLGAVVGDNRPLNPEKVVFEISQQEDEADRVVIARNARPGHVLGLNAGIYQVTSRYGDVNAIVRADIEVKAGKLTDMMIRHTGAEVTLKLVEESGGEALANTNWTVLTPAGETVHESVGAFPHIILAEGNYTAVAQHKRNVYSRDFKTEAGIDHEVEVRLADIVRSVQPSTPGQ